MTQRRRDDVALLTGIELCAGVGMLGEGTRAALEFLGHEYRTICYVEREAAAAGQLVTLMEAGIIDPAVVWSDMLTFDGAAWRGRVDCIIAGFPCQDLSIAGRRAGLDGERSGLFFRVCDIADDCGAQLLILENVSAIASATATVMDEAEGELEERAAARVMGELADRGWNAEWITISASDVGASHRRARWFCFAWRMADAQCTERGSQRIARSRGSQGHDGSREANGGAGIANEALADARCFTPRRQQHESGASGQPAEHQSSGEAMDNSNGIGTQRAGGSQQSFTAGCGPVGNTRLQHKYSEQRANGAEHPRTGEPVDNAAGSRRNGTWLRPEANIESGKCLLGAGCQNMGDAQRPRRTQAGGRSAINAGRESEPGCREVANASSPRLQERTGGVVTVNRFKERSGPTLSAFVTHSESSPQGRIAPTGLESSKTSPSSPRRLNPAFAAWLMGVPWWWTNPAVTSCAQSEMVLYRCALQRQLLSFFGDRQSLSARGDE